MDCIRCIVFKILNVELLFLKFFHLKSKYSGYNLTVKLAT